MESRGAHSKGPLPSIYSARGGWALVTTGPEDSLLKDVLRTFQFDVSNSLGSTEPSCFLDLITRWSPRIRRELLGSFEILE